MKKGWKATSLGTEIDLLAGFAFKSAQYTNNDDDIRLLRGDNIIQGCCRWDDVKRWPANDTEEYQRYQLEESDVVLAMDRPWVKSGLKHATISADDLPCLLVQRTARLRGGANLDNRFLKLLIGSAAFTSHILGVQTGIGVPHISGQQIKDFEFALPPLAEQQRIVGLLDEAFAGLANAKANAEKNLQNARALFESHLQSVFTQRGPGWVDRQLATLCHEITVGHVGSMKTEYKESGIPFLRSQNIRPFEVAMENAMFIDDDFHRALKKSQLRPGDLAIVRTGYPGTAAVIPPELPDSNCSDLVIVRPTKEVNPHFLAAFFNSAFGKKLVLGKIVGAAQKHFNVTSAKEVMLHLPPIAEQLRIICMVDELREETQRLAHLYEKKLAALEALKKSLLHQAFAGEL